MPRLTPVHWKVLECIFTKDGFRLSRHKGTSHRLYEKPGVLRPISIPTYSEVGLDIIKSGMGTANMTRTRYFDLLKKCKGRR